jgi:hypothetical protein
MITVLIDKTLSISSFKMLRTWSLMIGLERRTLLKQICYDKIDITKVNGPFLWAIISIALNDDSLSL